MWWRRERKQAIVACRERRAGSRCGGSKRDGPRRERRQCGQQWECGQLRRRLGSGSGRRRSCRRRAGKCWRFGGCSELRVRCFDVCRNTDLRHATMRRWSRGVHGGDGWWLPDGLALGLVPQWPVRQSGGVRTRAMHASARRVCGRANGLRDRRRLPVHQSKLDLSGHRLLVGARTASDVRWS
jgi:hypothetical protein